MLSTSTYYSVRRRSRLRNGGRNIYFSCEEEADSGRFTDSCEDSMERTRPSEISPTSIVSIQQRLNRLLFGIRISDPEELLRILDMAKEFATDERCQEQVKILYQVTLHVISSLPTKYVHKQQVEEFDAWTWMPRSKLFSLWSTAAKMKPLSLMPHVAEPSIISRHSCKTLAN
jgi:hypothetical protein